MLRAVEEEREKKEAAARAKRRDEDRKRQEAEAKQRRELEAKVMPLRVFHVESFRVYMSVHGRRPRPSSTPSWKAR